MSTQPVFREQLEELANRLCEEAGLLLVEFELLGSGKNTIVRLFVDRQGGVTVNECSSLSRSLSKELDELDLIPSRYNLEVSSPGLGRPFKHHQQYLWAIEQRIKVSLHEPMDEQHHFEGTLAKVSDSHIVIKPDSGQELEVSFDDIKEACRVVVFGRP